LPRLRVERRGGELVQLGELFRTLSDAAPQPHSRSLP